MRDTLIDLHNYSAMAIMLIDEEEKTEEKSEKKIEEKTEKSEKLVKRPSKLFIE